MSRTALALVLLLVLHIIIQQHSCQAVQSLDDFFPFGFPAGDTSIPRNDDESYWSIQLPYLFPYFDNNHRQIYQVNNGLFSFLGPISTYNPIEFPIANDQRLITPSWSDIDTRGSTTNSSDNCVYHHVYTRRDLNSTNLAASVLDKVTFFVGQYFPRKTNFQSSMVIVGTWYRVEYYNSKTDKLNTFQMVLATDESRRFAFFLYNDLQWTSPDQSNSWARQALMQAMVLLLRCIGITLKGPCFSSNNSNIICRFDKFGTAKGLILNEFQATCVSLLAAYADTVELSVSFGEGNSFNYSGRFTYMPTTNDMLTKEEIIIRKNGKKPKCLSFGRTLLNLNGNFLRRM
ncbi:unnamed protein product [Rotaria socialis]|uniref:NIDO domain-containing protein n=1 Tax=Rotaria socialis TaxID=392032 RepID=A0A820TWX7_9BILA|nr:unnamed protein product [Rotaria socialis]CAF4473561.1 unnamed protein product [Rotaria socialis]